MAAAVLTLSMALPPSAASAAQQGVRVTLPSFKVTLNGHEVDNSHREYPLLVYKDITYVPMTWQDSRMLGLETVWTEQSGLVIEEAKVTASYDAFARTAANGKVYSASIASFPVTVNGKAISSQQEEYPLLSFRDMIYFPLTWRFAHDEFGWDYNWDSRQGLSITSDKPIIQDVELPGYDYYSNIISFKGYYYFAGSGNDTTRSIYRSPVDNPSARELVYTYSALENKITSGITFRIRNDGLWFNYYVGGPTMGHSEFLKVHEDGTVTKEYQGKLDFTWTPYGTLITDLSVPPGGGNLLLELQDDNGDGHKDRIPIGRSDLIYQWRTSSGGGYGYSGNSATVNGEYAYVLASTFPDRSIGPNRIHRINLVTKESEEVTDFEVTGFQVIGDRLYYKKDSDGYLYSSDLNGQHEQVESDEPVSRWSVKDSANVYYISGEDVTLNYLYKADPEAPDKRVLQEMVDSFYFTKEKLICKLLDEYEYGAKVLDAATGVLQYDIADTLTQIYPDLDSDTFLFMTSENGRVKQIR